MKVLSYVHAYVPYHNGGAETTLHDLNKALISKGHECVVVVKESPFREYMPDYEIDGVKVVFAKDKRELLHHVPTSGLLLTHLECSVRSTIVAKKFKVPVAQIIHNDLDLTRGYIGHGPDFLIYNTMWIKEKFKEFDNIPSIVVHPPIRAANYKTDRGKKVTLVNLFESKGQDIFYALAERLPDINFLAVKGGYGEQVIRHDLPNVEFMDNDFDVRNVYAKTKVILMPSKYETYGRVACEAASCGIPSIVSDTPGLREALGEAGTYISRKDVLTSDVLEAWEKALRATLTPRKYGALSKAALERSEALDLLSARELEMFTLYAEQFVSIFKRKKS